MLRHQTATVDGHSVFFREAGGPHNPKVTVLHGFLASSHQYRNLIPALANRFHLVAPDYPGFGNSEMPGPSEFPYTFDKLSKVIESFREQKGFDHFGLYAQHYGGPVGFRIVTCRPDWLDWLIIQNSNAYEVGFTSPWDGFCGALWKKRTPETEKPLASFLKVDAIKSVYLHGDKQPELISSDNWNMDFQFMDRPNTRSIQLDLFYDYRKNVTLYIPSGRRSCENASPRRSFSAPQDLFFALEGGEAYLKDLRQSERHRPDSGHFAVEDCLDYIASMPVDSTPRK
jgi:pimeloyl-ACP methyl ester carboxylesterase